MQVVILAGGYDAYSTAKIETFQELSRPYGNDNYTWARIFQPYGLGQDSARYLPYLLESKSRNTEPKIHNPDYFCDWISVKDVAHALRFIIENKLFGPLDIGTGCGTTNLEMARIVQGTFDSDASHYFKVNLGSSRGLVVSSDSRLLQSGWAPTRSLKEEVLQMLMSDAL